MKKITIIGAGNLGTSIAKGFIESGHILNENLSITNTYINKNLSELKSKFNIQISTDNLACIKNADVVIFCLLPTNLLKIIKEYRDSLKKKFICYTSAGISISEVEKIVGNEKIFRLMPNTAAAVRTSMTCMSSINSNKHENEYMLELFRSIGESLMVEEHMLNGVTVLGASGIAFFLRYIRASIQAGVQMGFHPHEAQQIITQSAIGASKLLKEKELHPEALIDEVTTPKGVTIEGLNKMEQEGLTKAITKGLMSAFKRLD